MVQPALDHLNTLLDQARTAPLSLPTLPQGVRPLGTRDVVFWACKGYDVRAAVRDALSDPDNPRLEHWGFGYARQLARHWAALLHELSPADLVERWTGAVAALNDEHRAYARERLTQEVRKVLVAPLAEKDELQAVMRAPARSVPRVGGDGLRAG